MPANLNLGTAIELDMGDANKLSISANLNKLMVPSHTTDDLNFNNIPDHRERSYLEGLFGSFADAEGGLKEELSEISGGLGVEFWYINRLAFRSGYHYEHRLKGNNNFYTFGLGVKYKSTSINLAYNAPISQNTQFNRSKYAISMLYDINGDDEN